MSKIQEEIKEELWNQLAFVMNEGRKLGMTPLDGSEQSLFVECIKQFLQFLDSKDVVIKVDGELPRNISKYKDWGGQSYNAGYEAMGEDMLIAGYVYTERLI